MKKIDLRTKIAGPGGCFAPGIHEFENKQADDLIKAGAALEVPYTDIEKAAQRGEAEAAQKARQAQTADRKPSENATRRGASKKRE